MFEYAETTTRGTDQDRDEFVRENFVPIVWWLVGEGASVEDATDATQQSMIVTGLKWPHTSPHAFAKVVAKRAFVDLTRRAGTARKLHERLTALYDRTPAPAADTTVIFEADVTYVHGLLAQLAGKQREVMFHRWQGLSLEEIAELTGQKLATVRSNERHARTKLRDLIRDRKE